MTNENFPTEAFREAGYHALVKGQKTYNGVAIVSRKPLSLRRDELPPDNFEIPDDQARYLEAEYDGKMIISCLYLPNGNPVSDQDGISEKFSYKLRWMKRLIHHANELNKQIKPVVIGGDFNIIPGDRDCWDIDSWRGDALHHPDSLKLWHSFNYLGYTDSFRAFHPSAMAYSFWDYQAGAWQKDHGVRIDHLMLNPEAVDITREVGIDKTPRGGERASDHTPVWCRLDIP